MKGFTFDPSKSNIKFDFYVWSPLVKLKLISDLYVLDVNLHLTKGVKSKFWQIIYKHVIAHFYVWNSMIWRKSHDVISPFCVSEIGSS